MRRHLILAGLLLVFAGIVYVSLTGSMVPSRPPTGEWQNGRDQKADDFTLSTLDGGTIRLSDLRGKVVAVNFWATWCAPCREEVPALVRLQDEYRRRGVVIVGVSIDEEGPAVVRPFAEEFGINYPVVFDDGTVMRRYEGAAALPTTYFITRRGRIRRYMPGALTYEAAASVLDELLAEAES